MIIGICGGTGSGKTTISRAIVDSVGKEKVVLVEQDSYYRNLADMPLDERHQANFDHPDSLDSDMLVNHILRLKQGLSVEMPLYDFKTHTRSDQIVVIDPKPVVIVEGILIFAEPRVLDLLDVRVFVDTPDDITANAPFAAGTLPNAAARLSGLSSNTSGRSGRCTSSLSSRRSGTPTLSFPKADKWASAWISFAVWSGKS